MKTQIDIASDAGSPASSNQVATDLGFGKASSNTELAHLASSIELVPIEAVLAYERNPREHSDRQIAKLIETIKTVGFLVPMIVDGSGVVIAGHGRLLAAKRLGLKRVPVIRADYLSAAQVKAFRIADNRLSELGRWDDRALAIELKELTLDLDTDVIELTGFDIGEIDARLEVLEEQPTKTDPADQIEEPALGEAVTRIGDLWCLDEHRLYCGSSLEGMSYERLLAGRKARAVWSDPPYNVKIDGHVSGLGKTTHREFAMAAGEMAEGEFVSFLAISHGLCKQHSMDGALHYICMDAAHSYELQTAARQIDLSFKTTCTWAKTSAGMGSLYRSQTEFVHVFKNGGDDAQHVNNVQLGKYGRSRTTLWTYAGVNCFGRNRQEDLANHPTVKPWAMVADAIKDSTRHGEIVLDPFCGSGTTIVAAQKCGRIAYGIELDPRYVDVAIRRWQKLTKQQAVHAETGLTFAETEQRMLEAPRVGEAVASDGGATAERSAGLE